MAPSPNYRYFALPKMDELARLLSRAYPCGPQPTTPSERSQGKGSERTSDRLKIPDFDATDLESALPAYSSPPTRSLDDSDTSGALV